MLLYSSASSVLQDSASVEGALDSEIVSATVRMVAKLSLEAGGSGKFENSWKPPYAIIASSKGDSYAYCKLCSSLHSVTS